ncbi:hypothetical protein Q9L42_013005 [Methylomarinum sp. Ch1-1]|uniref:EF-hand domain-containing protein n=1 Tax=Methylomarinum roseum TaxID=3067653 RepID=A0AAU7NQP8_9GAMM
MKVLISSLITGSIMVASSSSVLAQSYAEDEAKEIVRKMDDNADKKVDFKEFYQQEVTDNQDSYDVNRDGYITSGEIELELKEDLIETVSEMNRVGVSEHDADVTITNTLNSVEQKSEQIVKQMDEDGDGLVENDEIELFERKKFEALDRDKDGFLTAADVEKKSKHKGFPIRLK